MRKDNPIGVFDSGLGGLTVMKAMMRRLPFEDIVYLGDTARVPYGTKSRDAIIRFSLENAAVLMKHHVKMIVVACNSSSSYALEMLREQFPVPVVGVIEPGVNRAVQMTKNRRIGVIATRATISSGSYERLLSRTMPGVKVVSQPCPLFVPLVEEGWFRRAVTRQVAEEYLQKIKSGRADTLILGCTHYPLLKTVITHVLGRGVSLVDSAWEVSKLVQTLLEERHAGRDARRAPQYKFLVSDQPEHFQKQARRFLGYDIKDVKRITLS
ncbi:MAG TPA: glutamate racemase [Candidatus Omnitrophota bacterium]|nr:glutamate racemase [Candidatus Omnitrophota bacterium]HPB67936.1 glutamate racemase [Candidatus Omnitrophota bacterium]HQO58372.1 glutamate racemase [Candidatus Omnitrophota bacterium]